MITPRWDANIIPVIVPRSREEEKEKKERKREKKKKKKEGRKNRWKRSSKRDVNRGDDNRRHCTKNRPRIVRKKRRFLIRFHFKDRVTREITIAIYYDIFQI